MRRPLVNHSELSRAAFAVLLFHKSVFKGLCRGLGSHVGGAERGPRLWVRQVDLKGTLWRGRFQEAQPCRLLLAASTPACPLRASSPPRQQRSHPLMFRVSLLPTTLHISGDSKPVVHHLSCYQCHPNSWGYACGLVGCVHLSPLLGFSMEGGRRDLLSRPQPPA